MGNFKQSSFHLIEELFLPLELILLTEKKQLLQSLVLRELNVKTTRPEKSGFVEEAGVDHRRHLRRVPEVQLAGLLLDERPERGGRRRVKKLTQSDKKCSTKH